MLSKKSELTVFKAIIILLLINYQVVTIVCNDFVIFKFLRDILLFVVFVNILANSQGYKRVNKLSFAIVAFVVLLVVVSIANENVGTSVVFLRRYLFPLLMLLALLWSTKYTYEGYLDLMRFIFNILFILSLWGIFQAYVLGDTFLMDLGYPSSYSYSYKRITLKMSYYFGGMGIQRVVSTLSNTNVLAVILGTAVIYFITLKDEILKKKYDIIKLVIIVGAYVLTFSRANFLAILIVGIILIWKYVPYKKAIVICVGGALFAFMMLYFVQDSSGITHKLVNWVVESLQFKESSASGRTQIWKEAFEAVKNNPFGIGFGKVGSYADDTNVGEFYHSENSYLAIALDLGWLGLFVYLCIVVALVFLLIKTKTMVGKRNTRAGLAIILYLLIVMMFSNHIYDMEVMTFVFLLIGVQIKKVQLVNDNR